MVTLWINGKSEHHLTLPHRGLAYGDGIFETLRIQNHSAPFLSAHLKRLASSAQALFLADQKQMSAVEPLVLSCLSSLPEPTGVLKILLLRHHQGRGYGFESGMPDVIVEFYPSDEQPWGWALPALHLGHCQTPVSVNSQLAGHKHLNRMDSVMATAEVRGQHWDDGLRFVGDRLIEATSANVFLVKDNQLLAPSLKDAGVKGIARDIVLSHATGFFDQVVIGEPSLHDVCDAEALFVTNAVVLLRSVASFTTAEQRFEYHATPACLARFIESLREEYSQ